VGSFYVMDLLELRLGYCRSLLLRIRRQMKPMDRAAGRPKAGSSALATQSVCVGIEDDR